MEKDLSYLSDKYQKKGFSNSEAKELEKLVEKFGKKFNIITIEEEFVYGYINNKRQYLGTKCEYFIYRLLKSKELKNKKNQKKNEEEEARKSFAKSYRKLESLDENLP